MGDSPSSEIPDAIGRERHTSTKLSIQAEAPGVPGEQARWSTGAKTGVGTAMSQQSRIWFTISHGILNEIYFPSIDQANTRSLQFAVAGSNGFLSDEEHGTDQKCEAGRLRYSRFSDREPVQAGALRNA